MEDQQHQDEFKVPEEKFDEELKLLEKYNNEQQISSSLARMSLFRNFDPLMKTESKSPAGLVNSPASNHDFPALQNGGDIGDTTTTLIHINTPSSKMQHHHKVENATAAEEGEQSSNINGHHCIMDNTIIEDHHLKQGTDHLDTKLLNELAIINEQVIDLAEAQLQVVHQQLENKQKEVERLSAEKDSLIEELNKVVKNYFDTHSRYENMQTIVKQMEARDAVNKERIAELTEKLGEKNQECQKWKHVADTQKYVF